jgi:uncharacterized protein YcbK (DUF882 family)
MLKYFTEKETACKCGCGLFISEDTYIMMAIDKIRGDVGKPLYIKSGARCQTHNTAEGGADNSFHMRCKAVDVSTVNLNSKDLYILIDKAMLLGLRWWLYPRHIHLDRPGNGSKKCGYGVY